MELHRVITFDGGVEATKINEQESDRIIGNKPPYIINGKGEQNQDEGDDDAHALTNSTRHQQEICMRRESSTRWSASYYEQR